MEQIWWERVPNAIAFTTDVVDHLLREKSIILNSTGEFPWYSCMVRNITESVKRQNSSKQFVNISDESDPGRYLLKKFCKQEKRAEYRPSKSFAEFFAESDDIVLHDRYIWVRISSKEQLDAWTEIVSEYVKKRGRNRKKAAFILETEGIDGIPARKGINIISFDHYVSEYDRIVFCTLASSSVGERTLIKSYLTELAANVAGNDIELCAECLKNHKDFLKSPMRVIEKILREKVRSNGAEYYFDKTENEFFRLIWAAQIRTIYPALEEYRGKFVERYSSEIKTQLPMEASNGEYYTEPRDVELGTLKFMADRGMLKLPQREYERLGVYKNARNKLSHLEPLTLGEIEKLEI